MATAPDSGLEARIATLEAAVRSLMATNWTDRASVVDASGHAVPLSSLAFGMVTDSLNDTVTFTGKAGAFSGALSFAPAPSGAIHPSVQVLVGGGRLQVNLAGQLFAQGNSASIYMSYDLIFLGPASNPSQERATVSAASNNHSLTTQDKANQGVVLGAGSFGLHTGLTPGWYSVEARYSFTYSSTSTAPSGSITNPSLAATPY